MNPEILAALWRAYPSGWLPVPGVITRDTWICLLEGHDRTGQWCPIDMGAADWNTWDVVNGASIRIHRPDRWQAGGLLPDVEHPIYGASNRAAIVSETQRYLRSLSARFASDSEALAAMQIATSIIASDAMVARSVCGDLAALAAICDYRANVATFVAPSAATSLPMF
jgi:hypothetical protein